MNLRLSLIFLLLAGSFIPLVAAVRLPSVFSSNMVVQCEAPVSIWGRAAPDEKVTVAFHGQHVETIALTDGTWRVMLTSMPPDDSPATMTIQGTNTISLTNILVGEVWLCAGQSNMTLRVDQVDQAKSEIAAAAFPQIRLFTVARQSVEKEPQQDCKGQWEECSPDTIKTFSAVAYFFGRNLHLSLKRPVGLIHSSWGGTHAEAWTPRKALAADPELHSILDRWAEEMAIFPRTKAEFEATQSSRLTEWKLAVEKAKANGRMPPAEPRLRTGPDTQYAPCGLYNAMIAPLAPFRLCGVIWYQGEANVLASQLYCRLFPTLIDSWRSAWAQPDLPFLYVQLPNLAREPEPSHSGWAEMREAQLKTLVTPHTAMVVTVDVGDPANLHPTHKQPVGDRLALAAKALVYETAADDSLCPVPLRSQIKDNSIRIEFAHAKQGLVTRDSAPLRGFVIASDDRNFLPADARCEGNIIIVTNPRVLHPSSVRYAWADNPDCNVTNRAGLPLSPFRTDDWPTPATATSSQATP